MTFPDGMKADPALLPDQSNLKFSVSELVQYKDLFTPEELNSTVVVNPLTTVGKI